MITEIIVMGALGLGFGLILAYLSQRFKVKVDPKIEEIKGLLPGANCGACGLAGCDAFAEAVVAGKVPVDGCIPGQKATADKISLVLGKKVEEKAAAEEPKKVRKIPFVIKEKCIGCKLCEKACNFDAIIVIDKKAEVSPSNCKKCMLCYKACPVNALT